MHTGPIDPSPIPFTNIASWWRKDIVSARQLLELATEGLVSPATLGRYLLELPASDAADLLVDERCAELVALNVPTPAPAWTELLKDSRRRELFPAVSRAASVHISVRATGPNSTTWRVLRDSLILRLAEDAETCPEVTHAVARMPAPAAESLDVALAQIEILGRSIPHRQLATDLAQGLIRNAPNRRECREIVSLILGGQRPGLRAVFVIPPHWDQIVGDMVLTHPSYFDLSTGRLLNLLGPKPMPPEIAAIIDERSDSPQAQAAALMRYGRWLEWRQMSRLSPETHRRYARQWLRGAWEQPPLEDWKRVLRDIGPIDYDVMRPFSDLADRSVKFPWIQGFEKEQIKDVAVAASDFSALGILVDLAHDLMRQYRIPADVVDLIANSSKLCTGMSAEVLSAFKSGPSARLPTLSFEQWQRVCINAGMNAQRFLGAYVGGLIGVLDNASNGVLIVPGEGITQNLLPRVLEMAVSNVELYVSEQPYVAATLEEILFLPETWIEPRGVERAAKLYSEAGFTKLAAVLLGSRRPIGIIEQLSDGQYFLATWQALAKAAVGSAEPHPMLALVSNVASLDIESSQKLQANGWAILSQALNENAELLPASSTNSAPLPCLFLAIAISSEPRGQLASKILLTMRDVGGHFTKEWFSALLLAITDGKRRGRYLFADDDRDTAVNVLMHYVKAHLAPAAQASFFEAFSDRASRYIS